MDIELRLLHSFVAVAEEMSFTEAARRLHMTQPPLSMQIRKLERELDVVLIDRSRRVISLTPAGETLLTEARPLLMQVQHALRATQRTDAGTAGRLTIGFIPSAAYGMLPKRLREFRARYPSVALFLREMRPDNLVSALGEGSIDVSFLYTQVEEPSLGFRMVAREPLVAAIPSDHPLASSSSVRIDQLSKEPFVMPARQEMPGLHACVVRVCREAGFEPMAVEQDIWTLQTMLSLVASGLGVALVPRSAESVRRLDLVIRPIDGLGNVVGLAAIWQEDQEVPALLNFLALLPEAPDEAISAD